MDKLKAVCGCGVHHSTPAWMWLLVVGAAIAAMAVSPLLRRSVRRHGFGARGERSAAQRANIVVCGATFVVCAAIGWRLVLVAAVFVAAIIGRAVTLGAREHAEDRAQAPKRVPSA